MTHGTSCYQLEHAHTVDSQLRCWSGTLLERTLRRLWSGPCGWRAPCLLDQRGRGTAFSRRVLRRHSPTQRRFLRPSVCGSAWQPGLPAVQPRWRNVRGMRIVNASWGQRTASCTSSARGTAALWALPAMEQGLHPHFVDPLGTKWIYTGSIGLYIVSCPGIAKTVPIAGEPTPVYEGGPPGDSATVQYFIVRENGVTHVGPGSLRIGLFSLEWVDSTPPKPGPPPGPPPACPASWVKHAPGFWSNHEDFNAQKQTAALCEKQCLSMPGCIAFDVCATSVPACDCYIFKGLVEPFTSNPGDLTCVRPRAERSERQT